MIVSRVGFESLLQELFAPDLSSLPSVPLSLEQMDIILIWFSRFACFDIIIVSEREVKSKWFLILRNYYEYKHSK
jgi:hypothetical protein